MGNELTVTSIVPIAALNADLGEMQEAMQANIGPEGISRFALPRIKVPTGGETDWRVPGLKGQELQKTIVALVVAWREGRAYYKAKYGEGGTNKPPDCSSENGIVGIGDPGGDCSKCPLAKFGSSTVPGSNAQACKNFRVLAVMRADNLMPEILTVPPTSLKACRQFFYMLVSKGVGFYGTLVEIGLNKTRNPTGIEYSEVTFSQHGERFPGNIHDPSTLIGKARAMSGLWGPILQANTQIMAQAGTEAAYAPEEHDGVPSGLPNAPRPLRDLDDRL